MKKRKIESSLSQRVKIRLKRLIFRKRRSTLLRDLYKLFCIAIVPCFCKYTNIFSSTLFLAHLFVCTCVNRVPVFPQRTPFTTSHFVLTGPNKIKLFSSFTKILEQRFTGKNGYNCLLPYSQTVKKIVADQFSRFR